MSLNIPDMSTPSVDLPDVSQTFNLQAQHHPPHNVPQDLILFSKKSGVIFYTHRNLLLDKSNNSFGKLLSHEAIEGMKSESANGILHTLLVTETTEIIDCLLRLLYGMSIRERGPSIEFLGHLFVTLLKYGYTLDTVISPLSEPFAYLLLRADEEPLQIYSLAAHHSFEALAVPTSTKALRISLSSVDESSAITMGTSYLLRLARLHLFRLDTLKSLLLNPPAMHDDTDTCKRHDRLNVQRAFGLTAGYLVWEATASIETEWIRVFFEGVMKDIGCAFCRENVRKRMDGVLEDWKDTKATI